MINLQKRMLKIINIYDIMILSYKKKLFSTKKEINKQKKYTIIKKRIKSQFKKTMKKLLVI